ncbi:MAG TPA: hypothetical protein EYG40_00115, partial [Verrucomicrobia bacterium]|nr:hypothetical protein [Verrucomicrobiota bacterium]
MKRGDRIYYRYDSNAGYEKTVGLENGDDDFPDHVWFISEEYDNWQDSIENLPSQSAGFFLSLITALPEL